MEKKRKHRFGDRMDGRCVRTLPPMSYVEPFVMRTRNDAVNYFEDAFDVTETDKLLRDLRKQGYKNMSILHIILAAYIRTVAFRPGVNRFISGQRIFHRDTIEVNMTVKKEMSIESPDTVVKVRFDVHDTLIDVYNKFNAVVEEATAESSNTDFDKVAKGFTKLPRMLFRIAVDLLYFLDYFGWLPRALLDVSPFHGSMFITSMGSLGIPPIYHHLYNFGNVPVFISYGRKYHKNIMNADGDLEHRTFVDMKAIVDERICDGYYYASSFKLIKKFIVSPALLLTPPETVIEDID